MNKKVLVVDDAEFLRVLLKNAVEAAGHRVVGEAENGEQAIVKFLELRPDVVTLDLVMPGSSGLDGLRGILQQDPKARVIAVVNPEERQELKSAIVAGAFDFLVKPIDQARVNHAIRRAADG